MKAIQWLVAFAVVCGMGVTCSGESPDIIPGYKFDHIDQEGDAVFRVYKNADGETILLTNSKSSVALVALTIATVAKASRENVLLEGQCSVYGHDLLYMGVKTEDTGIFCLCFVEVEDQVLGFIGNGKKRSFVDDFKVLIRTLQSA